MKDKTNVITFRVDEELRDNLDALANEHYYWKRSYIICTLLTFLFRFATKGQLFQIIRLAYTKETPFEITIKYEPIHEKKTTADA